MRRIIEYIRSCFCKHEFEYDERSYIIWGDGLFEPAGTVNRRGIKVSATCKKCRYHKSYWKF